MLSKQNPEMGPSQSSLFFLILALMIPFLVSSADYNNLVFKGCADQNFQDFNNLYRQTLQTLLDTLTSLSSSSKFHNTSVGSPAINGLFQCRGDLSSQDCSRCVQRTPGLAQKLCGQAMAARIQLNGCYLRYEVSGFRQVSGIELLYKVCGSTRASGSGFEDRLDMAMGEIVKGVGGGGSNGFYAAGYQSVYVMGQCEGDLSGGDCVNCVKSAVDRAKSECGSSISAQIYLQECYISYTYYPSGVPRNGQQPSSYSSSPGTGRNAQKTVAIVLGGLVGAGLVMACLLFTKSAFKKKTHTYKYGG